MKWKKLENQEVIFQTQRKDKKNMKSNGRMTKNSAPLKLEKIIVIGLLFQNILMYYQSLILN